MSSSAQNHCLFRNANLNSDTGRQTQKQSGELVRWFDKPAGYIWALVTVAPGSVKYDTNRLRTGAGFWRRAFLTVQNSTNRKTKVAKSVDSHEWWLSSVVRRTHLNNGGKGLDTLGASGWFIVCGGGVLGPQPVLTSTHTSVCHYGTARTQQLEYNRRVWIYNKA